MSQFASTDMDVRIVLSRSALPEDVAERVAAMLNAAEQARRPERLQELLARVAEAGATEWRRTTQVRENAGLLVMALLRAFAKSDGIEREIEGCTVRSVVFPGSHLKDVTLRQCSLIDVTVRRTDLRSTRFLDCEVRDALFFEPRVAPDSTRLELKGLAAAHVLGIRVPQGDLMETTYDPSVIAATLKECGASIRIDQQQFGPQVSTEYIMLLEQLMRAYRRANPVCKDDPDLNRIFANPHWSRIERLLVEHGVLEREYRSTKGKPKDFLRRRFLPEQIMSGLSEHTDTDARIRAFWRALALESETAAGG